MDTSHYELDAQLAEWHWWYVARRRVLGTLLDGLLAPDPGRRVLEVGCSTGTNLPLLARYGRVQGIEMSAEALAVCQGRRPEFPVAQGSIPEAEPGRFDLICLFDVLEHIDDDAGAVDWIADHLAPGGRAVIVVPAFPVLWSHHDELAHHKRRYVRSTLLPLLERRFDLDCTTYFNTILFPPILAVRLVQRLLGSKGDNDKRVGGVPLLNGLLHSVFAAERFLLPKPGLPFGVSLFASGRLKG